MAPKQKESSQQKNTFKFKKFSERISEIKVDVSHRVPHRNEIDSDDEEPKTNFARTIERWDLSNYSDGFLKLKKDFKHVVNLTQLVYHKKSVLDALKQCIESKDVTCINPVLDLVVAVARDLQIDFHEHFPEFLPLLINLLSIKDLELLEKVFTTLAYLFKYLSRYVKKNIGESFKLLIPLLVDSKPEYVNNFAAESFAFVARKAENKELFLQTIFQELENTPEGISGCGRLLFEVISGVSGQFHSCANQMLPLYINSLKNPTINSQIVFNVLQQVFNNITSLINSKHCQILWTVTLQSLEECLIEKNVEMLKYLVKLVLLVVNHKGGRMLLEPVPLITQIIQTISAFEDDDETVRYVINLSVAILYAENLKLSQETTSALLLKFLTIKNRDNLIYFVEKLITHSSFETIVLPLALQRSVLKETFDEKSLRLFAKIISVKAPPAFTGDSLQNWRRLGLNLKTFPAESINHLQYALENWENDKNIISEEALRAIIILPHINSLKKEMIGVLQEILTSMYQKLMKDDENYSAVQVEKRSFAFLLTLESLIHILEVENLDEFISTSEINLLSLIKKYPESIYTINTLDIFFSHMKSSDLQTKYINLENFEVLNDILAKNFSLPHRKLRLSLSHLYSLFKEIKEITRESGGDNPSAMELVYLAECVDPNVYTYRDRLIRLQALALETRALNNLDPKYHDFPLYYLLGNFYVNLSLLWDPVGKALSSYATEKCSKFWPIFLQELTKNPPKPSPNSTDLFKCDIILKLMKKFDFNDKLDHENYQLQLWKSMSEFPDYCEMKNRDLTVIFIDFIESKIFKSNSENAKTFSIEKKSLNTTKEDVESEDDDDDEEEEVEESKVSEQLVNKNKLKKMGKSADIKILLAQLKVFSQMHNPKMFFREAEINKIYQELLASKISDVQKGALDCLFTYKPKSLIPYKDNLYGLIDEKNLRNELARFRVANDIDTSEVVPEVHREELMPVLMRLVYAKMITRAKGKHSGSSGIVRRKIILRFLMGVKENEMMLFTKMALKPFEQYISLSPEVPMKDLTELISDINRDLDLSNVIPPKRLRSAVNLLGIIIEEFGGKMTEYLLPRLLGILICVLAQVKEILNRSDNVLSGFLSTLKELRTNCLGILKRFFEHFENYPWSSSELDALFDVAIFPWINRLPIEGIHSPTTLLKLLSVWCQNPRYFCLLIKHKADDKNFSCLTFIVKLFLGDKTHGSIINTILFMFEKLLTLQDYGIQSDERMETDEIIPLKPTNVLDVNPLAVLPGHTLNYGSAILFPYVPDILLFIKRKLQRPKTGVNKMEATILARISELNLDSDTSDTLLSLLLPILVKRSARGESEETILELLTTIANLLKTLDKPQRHIRQLLPLFYNVSALPARRLLIKTFYMIAKKIEATDGGNMLKASELLTALNAFDQRWLDQPDFEKRLDAFSEINAAVISEDKVPFLNLEFGVAVIYNCYYFLKNENDLSMKDMSGRCLNTLGPKLANMYKSYPMDRKFLVEETILSLVRIGIRSQNDNIRLQSISFLGVMSMKCADVHSVFRDLSLLTNKEDPEVDFFENLQHLQKHRKARALLKFCSVSKKLTKAPNSKTLTQFIFPLASSFLCNDTYTHRNNIVDAAIETVGVVCRLLPWYHYTAILKYYLDKLKTSNEYQRQIIRVIVSILDSFHFDLSKMNDNVKSIAEAKVTDEKDDEKLIKDEEKIEEADKIDDIAEAEEDLDEALAEEIDEEVKDEIKVPKEEENEEKTILIMEKMTVLSQNAANKVISDINQRFLPQLHQSILAKTQSEKSHKLNKKRNSLEKEEEELLRVPIALAVVKLLQKLPETVLDKNLPGIFMKLCTFLKSRLESVRRSTREILQKIMITLGPNYLHFLLKELNSLLTRGFQIHVLAFTIHSVLTSLKPYLQPKHMTENLQSILQVCRVDIFGATAEEKEISVAMKNVSEAKSTKSYDIFNILGQFINESCVLDLLEPLNVILNEARSQKTLKKVTECLRYISIGLADNTFIQNNLLLMCLYGIVSKSIPGFGIKPEDNNKTCKTDKKPIEKPDCFIIQPEPKTRTGVKAISKTSGNTNDHIMLEFGLKLLHILLKRDKVHGEAYKAYLDPFVPILANCLESQHVKLCTLALQCLNWVLKMKLDSAVSGVSDICKSIFKILHKYGSAGLQKGDNFDLVMAAFKTMSVMVRDVKYFNLSNEQLKALVLYAEQDIHDSDRQGTAFNLIKAIVGRKLMIAEIHDVMKKIASLSITSESDNIRQQCRVVFYHFLMDYPLGKKLHKHVTFYLGQLGYEMQPGRISALEMIHTIIVGFPLKNLTYLADIIFIMISARLVNDDNPACCKLAAKCIKELISRLPHNNRVKLLDVVMVWLKDQNILHRRLAAQVCGIFVTVEKESFESHLEKFLPIILKQFHAEDENNDDDEEEVGRFVKIKPKKPPKILDHIKDFERAKDHHAFQVLQLTLKISSNCPAFLKNSKYIDSVKSLAEHSQSLLAHPHLWVRLAATQQIGFILATIDEKKLSVLLEKKIKHEEEEEEKGFIYSNPVDSIRSLSLDLLAQLQPEIDLEELSDQVVKNLVFIARVIKTCPFSNDTDDDGTSNKCQSTATGSQQTGVSIFWLLRRLRRCINVEVTQSPKSTSVRKSAFKWIAGIMATIPVDPYLRPILFQLMSPLVREMMTIEESNAPLRQLSKEVGKMIKKKIGDDDYAKILIKVQQKLEIKKAERKKTHVQQFVIDPELAAKRKIAKQQKKKESKKRKKLLMYGKQTGSKRPRREVDLEVM